MDRETRMKGRYGKPPKRPPAKKIGAKKQAQLDAEAQAAAAAAAGARPDQLAAGGGAATGIAPAAQE